MKVRARFKLILDYAILIVSLAEKLLCQSFISLPQLFNWVEQKILSNEMHFAILHLHLSPLTPLIQFLMQKILFLLQTFNTLG